MKITNIKLNKNGKYVVTIDNEKYNLYQDTILKYLLFSKKEIDNTLFENIIKDNNFYDAYYKIIKFVSIRLRTENEIRKKLNTLFILKKDQDKIINKKLKANHNLSKKMFIVKVGNDLRNLGYTNYREILDNIDFDDKDIYQKEYDKIYNKLIKKYPPEKADILTKQKLYTKGF